MEAIRIQQVMSRDGEVVITGLPYRKGQFVEIILLPQPAQTTVRPHLTVRQFRELGLIGLWGDRDPNSDGFVDMQQIPVGTGLVSKLGNLVVRNPAVDTAFTRIVYQTSGSLGATNLEVANASNPSLGESLDARWIGQFELTDPNFPTLNADGTVLVFVGTSIDNNMTDLYLINFLTNELRRMTNGVGTFGAPALSPDGTQVVVP